MVQILGIVVLDELDPAGGARGHHGQGSHAAGEEFLDAGQELGAFLHDGQVGSPVGVKDFVKAHAAQGSCQLTGLGGACGLAEALGDAHADSGSGLDHHVLVGVVQGPQDTVLVAGLLQGANGADHGALTAVGAVGAADGQVKGGGDDGVEAAVGSGQDRSGLDLLADADAAAAQDALVGVTGQGLGHVDGVQGALALVVGAVHAQLTAQSLEFAVLVAVAGQALLVVVGEQQLIHGLARFQHTGVVGVDDHAVLGFHHAGGLQVLGGRADLLHHADTAGAVLMDAFQIAQLGDVNAVELGGLQDGAAGGSYAFFPVDGESDICHFTYLLSQRRQRLASARASSSCIPRLRSMKLPTACSASICLVRKRL